MRIRKMGAVLVLGTAMMGVAARGAVAQERPSQSRPAPRDSAHAGHAGHVNPAERERADSAAANANPHAGHAAPDAHAGHEMDAHAGDAHAGHATLPLGGGWRAAMMAQVYPIVTGGAPGDSDSPLHDTEAYLTQPAAMINVESPGSRLVLRTTLNFEALTQEDGEITYGGWGEGHLDHRHPHTLLHEAMLSLNLWSFAGGSASLSAGKGFAPYGTDDPMSRPVAKYPTNHHLSQILERWTVNGVYVRGPWSIEAGLFGGAEPEGPYDFSNIEAFGDSWSARVARRFGGTGTGAPWEVSLSAASVAETHHDEKERASLYNAAVRHAGRYGFGGLYALVEGSLSDGEGGEDFWSVLGETEATLGRHRPYYRVELATRPEYEREGPAGTDGFFRYDHDAHTIGATRWLINTVGYGYDLRGGDVATRPFVELQHNRVWAERGGIEPEALFGGNDFWSLTAGFRLYFGARGPMRMGSYGVLDDMTTRHAAMRTDATAGGHQTSP